MHKWVESVSLSRHLTDIASMTFVGRTGRRVCKGHCFLAAATRQCPGLVTYLRACSLRFNRGQEGRAYICCFDSHLSLQSSQLPEGMSMLSKSSQRVLHISSCICMQRNCPYSIEPLCVVLASAVPEKAALALRQQA